MNNPSKKILVVDNLGGVGQAGTGRSAAMFRNTFTSPDNRVLANSSIDYYLSIQNSGAEFGVDLLGYLWLMSERQLGANAKNIERMANSGVELKNYSGDEIRRLVSGIATSFESSNPIGDAIGLENISAGIFGVKCGKLEPDRLVQYYHDRFIERGGSCQFNTRVVKLMVEPLKKLDIEGEPFIWQEKRIAGVQVRGALDGNIFAETVVLAGGAWNNFLLEPIGLDGHVKSKKRQIFQVSTGGRSELRELLFTSGFNKSGVMPFTILPKCGIYIKPVKMGEQFWIGCDDEMNREFINQPDFDPVTYVPEPSFYQNEVYPVVTSYFPQFQNQSPSGMWAGLIAYNTMDYLPCIFQSENLIVVGGDSGSGIMKSDSLGRIVDALYRQKSEAELYGGVMYRVEKLGIRKRSVESEEWVL